MPEERKLATLLFADIVGSTELGSHDPEVVREALARAFGRVRDILVAHGGTVEKFIGDAVMAIFGVPRTHEDDAERAVRAAFAIRTAIADLNTAARLPLALRMGINSGEVVAGAGESGGFLVTGRPVNVAARLQEAAAPNEILVGPLARRLTETEVRYGPPRPVDAKGIGEIEASPALELISRVPAARRAERRRAPFVDREDELATLLASYRQAQQTRLPQMVAVFGVAGVGKSRLVSEFAARIGVEGVRRGQCAPYGEGITYLPLEQILRADAGIVAPESAEEATRKLRDAALTALASAGSEAEAVARRLLVLAGVASASSLADVPAETLPQELSWALRGYLHRRAERSPLTLVFEDLHWADAALLDTIDHLADRGQGALLFVCLARPELLLQRPWWVRARPNVTTLVLEPLRPDEARQLVDALLAGGSADARLADEIVARAEGNPLFLEEFVRRLLETGESPSSLPETVHGIIAARIDSADAEVKALLQRASVMGKVFWSDALVALGEDPVTFRRRLAEAVRRDFVSELDERGPGGGWGYRFKHVLIRDVAYATIPKGERVRLHDRFSRWLEAVGGERRTEHEEVVAYHAEQAYLLAQEIDLRVAPTLSRRAFDLLTEAAQEARERGDYHASLALFERAVVVGESAGVEPAALFAARGDAAIARLRLEPTRDTVAALDRVLSEARRLGPSEILVRLLIWRGFYALYESVEDARSLHTEAVSTARDLGDPELIGYALWASAEPAGYVGDLEDQLRILTEAFARLVTPAQDHYLVRCLVDLGSNAWLRGRFSEAKERIDEAWRIARERPGVTRFLMHEARAGLAAALGDWKEALRFAEHALAVARELDAPIAVAWASPTVGAALRESAAPERSRVVLEEGLAAAEDAPRQPFSVRLHAELARSCLALGDLSAARHHAYAAAAASSTNLSIAVDARAALAAVREAEGAVDDAERGLREALGLVEPTSLGAATAELRRELARLLLRQGRAREARELLELVIAFYRDPLPERRRREAMALLEIANSPA